LRGRENENGADPREIGTFILAASEEARSGMGPRGKSEEGKQKREGEREPPTFRYRRW